MQLCFSDTCTKYVHETSGFHKTSETQSFREHKFGMIRKYNLESQYVYLGPKQNKRNDFVTQ